MKRLPLGIRANPDRRFSIAGIGAVAALAQAMNPSDHRLVVLRRLALLCAVMVLCVTSLSAYIRLSKAGLGCADVRQCYGQSQRQLQSGLAPAADAQTATAAARLVHRVTALAALLLVLMMVMVCLGARPLLRAEAATALVLLGLALLLAVLGRWSSGARLPAVAMSNLLGGFAMLALCARLALAGRSPSAPGLRGWVLAAAALLLVQVALGGLVSASFAGLSCDGWASCLQAAQGVGWAALDPWREPVLGAWPNINPLGALPQALHRVLALVLGVLLTALAAIAWRRGRPRRALVLILVLLAQLAVGLAMVAMSLPLPLALLHNLLAASLLVALLLLF